MGKIKKILEKELGSTQSVEVYPVTSIEAVYDENNERLDNIINRKNNEIQKELEVEVTRASNAESNLRETINNLTKINENATSANIVTIDNIPNTSSSNVQQALNELFKNATFAGIATPTTDPGTPDGPVFYIATEAGTYSNFDGISVADGEVVILEWKGSWDKKTTGFATQQQLTELKNEIGNISGIIIVNYNKDEQTTRNSVNEDKRKTGSILAYKHPYYGFVMDVFRGNVANWDVSVNWEIFVVKDFWEKGIIFNLDLFIPKVLGFYTHETAIAAVPNFMKKTGVLISYRTSYSKNVIEQYIANNDTWRTIIGSDDLNVFYPDLYKPLDSGSFYTEKSARNLVPSDMRKTGLIVIYKESENNVAIRMWMGKDSSQYSENYGYLYWKDLNNYEYDYYNTSQRKITFELGAYSAGVEIDNESVVRTGFLYGVDSIRLLKPVKIWVSLFQNHKFSKYVNWSTSEITRIPPNIQEIAIALQHEDGNTIEDVSYFSDAIEIVYKNPNDILFKYLENYADTVTFKGKNIFLGLYKNGWYINSANNFYYDNTLEYKIVYVFLKGGQKYVISTSGEDDRFNNNYMGGYYTVDRNGLYTKNAVSEQEYLTFDLTNKDSIIVVFNTKLGRHFRDSIQVEVGDIPTSYEVPILEKVFGINIAASTSTNTEDIIDICGDSWSDFINNTWAKILQDKGYDIQCYAKSGAAFTLTEQTQTIFKQLSNVRSGCNKLVLFAGINDVASYNSVELGTAESAMSKTLDSIDMDTANVMDCFYKTVRTAQNDHPQAVIFWMMTGCGSNQQGEKYTQFIIEAEKICKQIGIYYVDAEKYKLIDCKKDVDKIFWQNDCLHPKSETGHVILAGYWRLILGL